MSSTLILQNLASDLYSMFDKKKFGGELSEEERALLPKFERSKLIRALIDPEVGYDIGDYVPPQMEVEIAFSIISGRPSINFDGISLPEMVRVVGMALNCAKDLDRLLKGA